MSVMKHLPVKTLTGLMLGMICAGMSAAPDFTRDLQFAKLLNENGLTDYADIHISNLLQQYPGTELLKAQQIDNLIAQKKIDEAVQKMKELNTSSDAYFEAAASLGIYSVSKKNYDEGIKFLSAVFENAQKTGKLAQFEKAAIWLMSAYMELGHNEDAQKVRSAIEMSKSSAPMNERDKLYAQAVYALEAVEGNKEKLEKDGAALNQKYNENRRAALDAAGIEKRYAEAGKKLNEKLAAITDQARILQIQETIKKKAETDKAYYESVKKYAVAPEAVKARTETYKLLGELVDLTADEMNEIAKAAADKGLLDFRKAEISKLEGQRNQLDGQYNNDQRDLKKDPEVANKNRMKVYYQLGTLLEIPESEMRTMAEIKAVQMRQPARRGLILRGLHTLNDAERGYMERSVPLDWMDSVYIALRNAEKIQWGGLDFRTATAIVVIMRSYYYMGTPDAYEKGLTSLRKSGDLFDLCDAACKKDQDFPIELSPGADAKMWEGMLCEAIAKNAEAKDKAKAVKYYKKAFVAFGKLLKNYPKHRDGAKNYPHFQNVVKKIADLDPKIASKLQAEAAKVKKPELAEAATVEIKLEELVTPLAAKNFKDATKMAADLSKKDRTKTPASAADWQKCLSLFDATRNELLPQLNGKYKSNGLPKLMNHLLICSGFLNDPLLMDALIDYGFFKFAGDPLVAHGILMGTNAMWTQADRMSRTAKTPADQEKVRALKDQAIRLYDLFLKFDLANESAPLVAVRIAREEFIRANALGQKLNDIKNPADRRKMMDEWEGGFDRSIGRYTFIRNNFNNRADLVDEAFERSAEAYVLTERFVKAADMLKEFCEHGSRNPGKIVTAKMDIAANLYRQIGVMDKKAADLQAQIDAIVIPEMTPEETELAKKAAETPAAEVKPDAAAAAPQDKAKADMDAAVQKSKEIATKTEELKRLTEELNGLKAETKELCKDALNQVNELLNEWLVAGGKFDSKDPSLAINVTKNKQRAYSLLPWLYDGAGDQANAAKAFDDFVQKYPEDKSVPQYLMRESTILVELGRDAEAEKLLNTLSQKYKDTPEGRNAKFALVRTLYKKGNYELALKNMGDIFASKELEDALNVSHYRWIASEMANCSNPKYRNVFADFAIRANEKLISILKNPSQLKMDEWVANATVEKFKQDTAKRDEYFKQVLEKLRYDIACAYYNKEDDQNAIKNFNEVEKNKKTPYYYDLTFMKTNSRIRLAKKSPDVQKIALLNDAIRDLLACANRANLSKLTGLYNKSQVIIGEIYELRNDTDNAYSFYMLVAALPISADQAKFDERTPEDDSALYIEKAVYKSAELGKKLGKPDPAMVKKYKELWPNGKYIKEINGL